MVGEYLAQVLIDEDVEEMVKAIDHAAKARGMTAIADVAELGHESMHKIQPWCQPRFDTSIKILRALGVELRVHARVAAWRIE